MSRVITLDLEEVTCCPICGGKGSFNIEATEPERGIPIRMYACDECETVYHNPRMTLEAMDEYYRSGEYRLSNEIDPDGEANRAERLVNILGEIKRQGTSVAFHPKRCLDVGCARGYFLDKLYERYGCEVIGYDLYSESEHAVQTKDEIGGKFDLISFIHTLEHTIDPIAELQWVVKKLTDDGYLLLELPTINKVNLSHPAIPSRKAIQLMMQKAGLRYQMVDAVHRNIAIILAQKIPAVPSGTTVPPSPVEFYNNIFIQNPNKWANVERDFNAFRAVSQCVRVLTGGRVLPFKEEPERMMDVGCGNGHTIAFFKNQWPNTEYTGVDISDVALEIARERIPDAKFSQELPLGNWDVITVMGVAEHFEDPVRELHRIGTRLSPDGVLYLEVPNCLAYSDELKEGFRQTRAGSGQNEWHWRRETWERAILDADFEIVRKLSAATPAWEFCWVLKLSE